jgi:hypothetical protein
MLCCSAPSFLLMRWYPSSGHVEDTSAYALPGCSEVLVNEDGRGYRGCQSVTRKGFVLSDHFSFQVRCLDGSGSVAGREHTVVGSVGGLVGPPSSLYRRELLTILMAESGDQFEKKYD